jgi:hypothetical protein
MHNYQRSYPLKHNEANPANPIITTDTNNNTSNYTNTQGRIFVIVGTAGARFFPLYGKAPYILTQFLAHGFLDVSIINNGKTLQNSTTIMMVQSKTIPKILLRLA